MFVQMILKCNQFQKRMAAFSNKILSNRFLKFKQPNTSYFNYFVWLQSQTLNNIAPTAKTFSPIVILNYLNTFGEKVVLKNVQSAYYRIFQHISHICPKKKNKIK